MIDLTQVDVETLYVGEIGAKPIDREWDGDGLEQEAWSFAESFTYDHEGAEFTLITSGSGGSTTAVVIDGRIWELWDYDEYAEHCDSIGEQPTLSEDTFEALRDVEPAMHGAEGPMMNHWYPLPWDDAREAAAALAGLPLCAVEVEGTNGIALTGGGMDLSWEIAAGYIALGFLPPVHFAELPSMGRGQSASDQVIIAACLRSLTTQRDWMQRSIERLTERAESWKANGGY